MLSWIRKQFDGRSKKTATITRSVFVAVFLFLALSGTRVWAQTQNDQFGLQPIQQTIALSSVDPRVIIMQVIRAALGLLGIVALVLILYAGYMIMTSQGEEEKVTEGKRILTNAVIGLAIILSAFAIVQFILNQLAGATGFFGAGEPSGGNVVVQTFGGSGALGRIIRDHYPFRDQKDVARNAKIAVTFREPIDPASLIQKRSGSILPFGKCRDVPQGETMDFGRDCDQIKSDAVQIYASKNGQPLLLPAAVLTVPSEQAANEYKTFVFRPLQPLGNERENVVYTVKLTSSIKKKNGKGAFETSGTGQGYGGISGSTYYSWEFTTSNRFDYTPPKIISTFPARPQDGVKASVARNAIVQINFDKAMDPTMVQGTSGANGTLTNIIFGDASITGEWRISNEYRTVSFVSDIPCGTNSCGEQMYCLPKPRTQSAAADETVLVRTAQLVAFPVSNPQPIDAWQAIPFSGVMDMYGNALEGNRDAIPDNRPTTNNPRIVTAGDRAPDNDYWNFTLRDTIDASAPYVNIVSPNVDDEGVSKTDPITITFGEQTSGVPMWDWTLADIGIVEYPTPANPPVDPIWKRVTSAWDISNGISQAVVEHREFGPNGQQRYYFPTVPSTLKNAYQNCLYPGRGPARASRNVSASGCVYNADTDRGVNCVGVTRSQASATGCAQTDSETNQVQPNMKSCIDYLSNPNVSPQ